MFQSTACGQIKILDSYKSRKKDTTVWLGRLCDGRFCVSSRWEYYVVTKKLCKAEEVFARMMKSDG